MQTHLATRTTLEVAGLRESNAIVLKFPGSLQQALWPTDIAPIVLISPKCHDLLALHSESQICGYDRERAVLVDLREQPGRDDMNS